MARQPEIQYRLVKKVEPGEKPTPKGQKRKILKDSLYSIYLQYCYHNNRVFYPVGQSIKGGDWNQDKQEVKNNTTTTGDGKHSLNELLHELKTLCKKTYNDSLKDGEPRPAVLTAAMDAFINRNHNEAIEIVIAKPTLFTLADRFISGEIKNKGKDKSKSSLQNYAAVTKHLRQYEIFKKITLDFESINLDFFYSYVDYLKKKLKLSHNTIAKDISILKVFMNEAIDLEYTENYKFRNKKFSFNEVETEHVYLKEDELHHLFKFDLSDNKRLEQVRDLFVFGAWTGLRISDYSNVKPENIVTIDGEMFIDLTTKKTDERVIIPCNPVVLEIFDKYSCNPNKLPKAISDQRFNAYIKEACQLAGMVETGRLSSSPQLMLWECVSSHTCRRSFASNYFLQGFPTLDLMKITTHKTERSFMKYIKVSKLDTAKRLSTHNKLYWSKKMMKVA